MSFLTHFQFKSVLSSNTHSWLAKLRCSWRATSFHSPFFSLPNLSCFFCCMIDKHFETNEKNSNRTDESITPFYATNHRLVWWVGWIHIFFLVFFLQRKLHLISLLFVHYNVIKLRNFWWNYFLNNSRLPIGLLRLVCFLMTNALQQQF